MLNHREWLDGFKNEIEHSKRIQGELEMHAELKKIRIKSKAEEVRKMIREGGVYPEAILKSKVDVKTVPIGLKENYKRKIN